MAESILKKYAEHRADTTSDPDSAADSDAGATCSGSCFGCVRGNPRERAIMLELRKANGSILAVGYAWLEWIDFEPSEGLTLHVAGKKVRIKGRNLNRMVDSRPRLFASLTNHRVLWAQEADRSAAVNSEDDATVIESIEW